MYRRLTQKRGVVIPILYHWRRGKNDTGSPHLNGIKGFIRFRQDLFSFSIDLRGDMGGRFFLLVRFGACEPLCDIRDNGFEFPLPGIE